MTMDRTTFKAIEVSWRRAVGEVSVTRHATIDGQRAYDYLTLQRICSKDSTRDVVSQMLELAIAANALLNVNVTDGHTVVRLGLACEADATVEEKVQEQGEVRA